MAVSDTLIDTLFDGRYHIVRKLGAGGMANVYLAEDQELGRRVAIKILNERHANDEQFVERFRREAKNAAGLSHPNIVSIYDRGEAEGTYYIAMEHLDGRNLKELITARGPAPPHVAVPIVRQVLSALGNAHRNGIVHRDIKPHNVMIDSEQRVKVTDFGIARAGASQMTEAGSIVGTAQYLSPEQARGATVDHRSDLYSVGVVLYELLTGKVPFTGDSPVEIAMKHLSSTPPAPSELNDDVTPELDKVVMRALAKDPERRYQDAAEMDGDLERLAAGLGVSDATEEAATAIIAGNNAMPTQVTRAAAPAAPPTAYTRTTEPVYYEYDEPARRRPIWPWIVVALLLIGTIVGGWYVYNQVQEELAAREPVAVPLLEGLSVERATANLDERGLQYEIIEEETTEQREGFVFDQNPEEGTRIDPETGVVEVYVSLGPPTTEVPSVVGLSREAAVAELTRANLEAEVFEVFSGRPVGEVTGQQPAAGDTVEEGTSVRINVSKGRRQVPVPNVVGQDFETAAATLEESGFQVAREESEASAPEGTVFAQSPDANALAARGDTVTLSVSTGPAQAEVPPVEGLDEGSAAETLEDAGFGVAVEETAVEDASLDGIVVEQNPPSGEQAEVGATVTIVVGRFEGDGGGGDGGGGDGD